MIDLLCSLSRLAAAAIVVVAALSHAQTAPLNDTGQASCYDASNVAVACDGATAGNTGTRPHQDGRYGRDATAAAGVLSKVGGGVAGFDFSCVLWNGTVINGPNCHVGLVVNYTESPSAETTIDWACTKDNVTGRVWSLQVLNVTWNTASIAHAGDNSQARCGGTNWRLPTVGELLSIIDNGRTSGTLEDLAYFPYPSQYPYWAADVYIGSTSSEGEAWYVASNGTGVVPRGTFLSARLVRNGL